MAPGYSVAVSLCDILRTLLKELATCSTECGDDVAAVRQWLDDEKSREWVAENVVASQSFTDVMDQSPPATARSIMQAALDHLDKDGACSSAESPPVHATRNVVELMSRCWKDSDLQADGAESAPSVTAIRNAYKQLPMMRAVRQALAMFPVDVAAKLDRQAASVGESVRKTGKTNPADVIGSVMANPQFMEMMQGMMNADEAGPSAEALQHERDIDARIRLLEHRVKALEAGGSAGKQGRARNQKKHNTRAGNVPTY
jgi:hypothetical protein